MTKYTLGKLPNMRTGFFHVHLGSFECGMAYWLDDDDSWQQCKRLVNHLGPCGYEDNSAF